MKSEKFFSIQSSILFSKICVNSFFSTTDPNNFSFLLGHRSNLFHLANPFLVEHSLKTGFYFFESFVTNGYRILFIADFSDERLSLRLSILCKQTKNLFLKNQFTHSGFLTTKKLPKKILIVSLFLDGEKTQFFQKICFLRNVPLLSFADFSNTCLSSSSYLPGNYSTFFSQNLVVNFLSICLFRKLICSSVLPKSFLKSLILLSIEKKTRKPLNLKK